MDYMALEHNSSEMENSVTAGKTVGTGCINKKQVHKNHQKWKKGFIAYITPGPKSWESVSLLHMTYTER